VFAYVGLSQNLKDLKAVLCRQDDHSENRLGVTKEKKKTTLLRDAGMMPEGLRFWERDLY